MFRLFLFTAVLCSVGSFLSPGNVVAQDSKKKKPSFEIKKFLNRLDANQNGVVEPGEVTDERTRNFLRKSGADPSKSININSFSKQIKKQRAKRNNPDSAQRSSSFAVNSDERDDEGGEGQRFTVSQEEREPVKRGGTREFSEGAKNMLAWVLKNYDRNKDGKIDAQEIKSSRWSDPPASESDTNKDGTLSRMELLVRYEKREEKKRARKDGSRSSSSSESRRGSSDSRRSDRSSSYESKSKDKSNRTVRKGYESYVNGLFKTYDKNKDGSLDKDEIEKMRRKPDMKADKNRDKVISKSELIDAYLEKTGHGKSSSSSSSSKSSYSARSRGSSRPSSGSSAGSSRSNVRQPLTEKDSDKNGQIEMSEYESRWTVDKIEEFKRIDKNDDGIITRKEWDEK